jgi:hypothetical protein
VRKGQCHPEQNACQILSILVLQKPQNHEHQICIPGKDFLCPKQFEDHLQILLPIASITSLTSDQIEILL